MNRYLISAAALALLAAPAFAQPDNHDHGDGHPGGGGGHERPAGGAGPAARPAAPAARPAAPAAAPAAAPQVGRPDRGGNAAANTGNGRLDATAVNRALVGDRAPQQGNRSPDNNRGFDNRGSDNRGPGNGGNFGPGNRPGNGGARPGNAPRPDFSHFNDFHRNFRAQNRFHAPSYSRPPGFSYRRWTYGEFLPSLFWNQQYWLSDYGSYDLPPPPPGTTWVRYGNDALLIDRYSGEIVTVEYSVFY